MKGPDAAADNFAAKVGATHAVYVVAAAWKNRRVDLVVRAPGLNALGQPASVWFVFGRDANVQADRTAFVTGTPPAWTGDAKIARPIRDGETRDYFVDDEYTHFSVESDLADVEFYVFPSDYALTGEE